MLTVTLQLVDYNRSPSVTWLRATFYTHALPRKGERIADMPAFSVRHQGADSMSYCGGGENCRCKQDHSLREGERVTLSGNVNQLTWKGEREVIIEVFGTYTREGAHGPVST